MSKYEEMSDFEINKLVALLIERLGLLTYIVTFNDSDEVVHLCEEDGLYSMIPIAHFDPCNNPADAWPIILEYKIGIDTIGFKGGEDRVWWAELTFNEYGDHHYAEDKNPLRAAMIVYLMLGNV